MGCCEFMDPSYSPDPLIPSFLPPPAPNCPFEVLGCQMTSGAIRSAEGEDIRGAIEGLRARASPPTGTSSAWRNKGKER